MSVAAAMALSGVLGALSVLGGDAIGPESAGAAPSEGFVATFDTPSDFYDRFDYGFSGIDPASVQGNDRNVNYTGDHNHACDPPTTQRAISIDRPTSNPVGGTYQDFGGMFWWCRGHMMTAIDTFGYNIAWFSPKPLFTEISRVCWDVNVTQMSSRKWTQVLFVPQADAALYPSARGSGGFDLGFTNPDFRDLAGPTTGILPRSGGMAGARFIQNGFFGWFQQQNNWTSTFNSAQPIYGVTDKATRYTHCLEQVAPGTVRFSQNRPATHGGFQAVDVPGTIPAGPVRVVFQDDNYDGPKAAEYRADTNTWHWDNIQITTGPISGGGGGIPPAPPPSGPTPPAPPPPAPTPPTTLPPLVEVPPSAAGMFDSLSPVRLLDTRHSTPTIDGLYSGVGRRGPGSVTQLQVSGRGRVPVGARAVALNVTVVDAGRDGHVTVFPCGTATPLASNTNYRQGETVAAAVVVGLDGNGRVCLFTSADTDVVVDATGAFPSQSPFTPITPSRLADTRRDGRTVDGRSAGDGVRAAGSVTEIQVTGRAGVPGTASAVVLNVTAVHPSSAGHLTVFPCGESIPHASNVNFRAASVSSNLVIAKIGASGRVCVFNLAQTDLLVDVSGWTAATSAFRSVTPSRLLDTRSDGRTVDGAGARGGRVGGGRVIEVQVAGRAGVPADAGAAALNVTITDPVANGHATVFPCGQLPLASNVNFTAGEVRPNAVLARLGSGGKVCVFVHASANVIVDVIGSFAA